MESNATVYNVMCSVGYLSHSMLSIVRHRLANHKTFGLVTGAFKRNSEIHNRRSVSIYSVLPFKCTENHAPGAKLGVNGCPV